MSQAVTNSGGAYDVYQPSGTLSEGVGAVLEAGPMDAWSAMENADYASAQSRQLALQKFPNGSRDPGFADYLHNGEGDAIRHCNWNCRNASMMPASDARQIGKNHEDVGDAKGQPAAERDMDLHNNEVGVQLGLKNKNNPNACLQSCSNAYSTGQLCSLNDVNNKCP